MTDLKKILIFLLVFWVVPLVHADDGTGVQKSPWIFTPIFSSDPKISTAAGAMAVYVHKFDDQSPASTFGLGGTYSTTDSYVLGLFGKMYFGQDNHRLLAAAVKGEIRNDYSDFLGTGQPVQTTDNLDLFVLRYYRRLTGNWYAGPQAISTNYAIAGDNFLSGQIIEQIGLTGFKSNGLGLVLLYDSKDDQNATSRGQVFEVHNIAYRQSFGGEASFDAYSADYQFYHPHGKGHVLAAHLKGRWTKDAPSSGYSSIELRGYVRGQYLAPHMTLLEVEERFALTEKWGLTAFVGVAGLYGSSGGYDLNDSLFPAGGVGISYQLNDEKMVVRAEAAMGKSGNNGFYVKFGQPF